MTLENLAKQIFNECEKDGEPISMEDALEMAKMEINAKGVKNYEQSLDKPRKSDKPKVVKVSDEKQSLFNEIWTNLSDIYCENAQIVKENKLIIVKIGEKTFKIDIIEQRPTKK